MKISAVALLSILGVAAANKPQLAIKIADGTASGLDGLDPTLSWSSSTSSGDLDIEFGVEASVKPTSNIASLPKGIWGKVGGSAAGWAWSARADIEDVTDLASADLDINADNEDGDLSLNILASIGDDGVSVNSIEASKKMDDLTISPKYDLGSEEASVTVNWSSGDTEVELVASADAQSVTVGQQLDDDNKVTPSITSDGDISVAWERSVGDDSTLTATVGGGSVDLEWEDGAWTANINVDIDGTSIDGTTVGIKRDVTF